MHTSILRPFTRRAILILAMAAPLLNAAPALAATPAEAFVTDNIDKGMAILNNKKLSGEQRRSQFESLLLGLIDMKRIADYALANYIHTASPAEIAAYDAAFQDYATATYQFYFSKYSGQTLKVFNSQQLKADDTVVMTHLIDPNDHSGQLPAEVDFRIRTNTGRPVLVDVAFQGVWLSTAQRDMVVAVLGNGNGGMAALTTQLHQTAAGLREK